MTITAKTKTVVALAEQAIEANTTEQELRRLTPAQGADSSRVYLRNDE